MTAYTMSPPSIFTARAKSLATEHTASARSARSRIFANAVESSESGAGARSLLLARPVPARYARTINSIFSASTIPPRDWLLAEIAALDAAFRLRPDAGEAHLARGEHLYRGYLDYDGALAELEIARRTLPNDPSSLELTGYIARRRGKHEEGLRNLQRAIELDPRNFFTLQQIALSYLVPAALFRGSRRSWTARWPSSRTTSTRKWREP